MTRYSTITLRTEDRANYYTFQDDIYITGLEGIYDMPERNKSIQTVFGRDGGFEVYGGLSPKIVSMDIEILVADHEDVYDIMETLHLLFSYQNLELYMDPPKRYVKVSYKKDSLTEQLGYAGKYIRGRVEFDVVDPFWYSQIPKMVVGTVYATGTDGTINGSNYFFSQQFVENYSGFNTPHVGKVLNVISGTNEGYYEIVSSVTSGCTLSSSISTATQTNISYSVYNQPNLSRSSVAQFTFSGQAGKNCYLLTNDDYMKTYYDMFKTNTHFNGTMTIDSDKVMFTSGLSEIEFKYSDYLTVESLVSGINDYTPHIFTIEYLHKNPFVASYTRNTWHPSGLYGMAYEPMYSGQYRNILMEDKTFTKELFPTIGDISGYIGAMRNAGDFTYKFLGLTTDYAQMSTKALIDRLDTEVTISGGSDLYAADYLEYTKAGGNIPVAGNYRIYPVIQVINRGLIDLDGFDIIQYTSGNVEAGRIAYYGTLADSKLIEIDTLNKTIREFDLSLTNKDDYINNVYTNRLNKTTSLTDFVYLYNDNDLKLVIDTDSENAVDVDFLIKWTDRYI